MYNLIDEREGFRVQAAEMRLAQEHYWTFLDIFRSAGHPRRKFKNCARKD